MSIKSNVDRATRRSSESLVGVYSGVLTASEEVKLRHWREQDSEFNQAFDDTNYALAKMQGLENDPDIREMMDEPLEDEGGGFTRYLRPLPIAATLLMAAAVTLMLDWRPEAYDQNVVLRYVTRVGEQKQVELKDGSTVNMNTGTLMLVDINDGQRRVILERGEAIFDVAKDPSRPFSVELGSKTVEVLGTRFNVYKSPESYQLAVLEGLVSFQDDNQRASAAATQLEPELGSQMELSKDRQYRVGAGVVVDYDLVTEKMLGSAPKSMDEYQGWTTGFVQFDDDPLFDVAKELNRYSAKKVLIEDESILDLKILASVKTTEIDMALTSMEEAYPIRVIRHFDSYVIKGRL